MTLSIELTDEQLDALAVQLADRMHIKGEQHPNMVAADTSDEDPDAIAIYAIYRRVRVDAWYYPASKAVSIAATSMGNPTLNTLIQQKKRLSPTGAAVQVVKSVNPEVKHPDRNGWGFWMIVADDKILDSIRHDNDPNWDDENWEADHPGVLPKGLCNVFPKDAEPPIPCMYQDNHRGKHHWDRGSELLHD